MQRNVTWQTSSEYRRLTVPSGRTLNYISFVRKIQIPEIFGSPLVHLHHMQNWYYCIILEAEEIDSHIYIVHFHI
jgi:hypothetical protein